MSVRPKPNREGEAPAELEQDRGELPDGWAWARMLDVLDYEGGSQPPKKDFVYEPQEGYVRLLQIRDFGEKPFPTFVPKSSRLKTATANDLLLARYGGSSGSDSLGRVCSGLEGAYNVALAKLIFDRKHLDPEFVRALFLGPWFRAKVSQNSRSCQTGFNRDDVEDIWFPIAPHAEQRRIVGKLELLLGKVSSSQQRLSRVPGLLKRFRQSVLAAACSGKLTADWREENDDIEPASTLRDRIQSQLRRPLAANEWEEQPLDVPPTWEWVQAEDLCRRSSTITYGVLKPVWVTQGVPTVRVQDMKGGMIAVEAVGHCSPERAEKFSKTTLEVGDLLIAKDGATLGKTAFVPASLAGGNITQHVLRFPITPCVATVFVRLVIDSRHGREWMRIETKGVALPGVNVGDFRRMPIPLPPLSEQQEIVRRVEKLFAFADQIEARLRQAQAHVDRLTQSLLAKAFRGELVPTEAALAAKEGRDYETAETLLTRIRATSKEESIKPSQRKKGQVRDA